MWKKFILQQTRLSLHLLIITHLHHHSFMANQLLRYVAEIKIMGEEVIFAGEVIILIIFGGLNLVRLTSRLAMVGFITPTTYEKFLIVRYPTSITSLPVDLSPNEDTNLAREHVQGEQPGAAWQHAQIAESFIHPYSLGPFYLQPSDSAQRPPWSLLKNMDQSTIPMYLFNTMILTDLLKTNGLWTPMRLITFLLMHVFLILFVIIIICLVLMDLQYLSRPQDIPFFHFLICIDPYTYKMFLPLLILLKVSFMFVNSPLRIIVPLNLILMVLLSLIIRHAALSSAVTALGRSIMLYALLVMPLCLLLHLLAIKDSVIPTIKT